jgi:hypothetical protein
LVVLAVLVLMAAGCSSAGGGNAQSPGRLPAAANAAGHAQPGVVPGVKPSGVPWAEVGAGWTLAEYSASTGGGVMPHRDGATTLYLVNPRGAKNALYRWPAGQADWTLLDWSGDKTRALFLGPTLNAVGQLVLATGQFISFKLPSGTQPISYTRPEGTAILATEQAGGTDKLLRYSLAGRLEQAVMSGSPGSADAAIYSPNGATLVVNGAKALEVLRNNGSAVRSLMVPGYPTCQPVRWWNVTTILASCTGPGHSPRLWLVPVTGARPSALTPERNANGPDYGDIGAWPLPSGLYLQAVGACGVIFIAKQISSGSVAVVNVPQTTGNDNQIVTALGPRLLVRAQTSCEPSTSLLWFNPASDAVQMLIRAPARIEGVLAAVAATP